MMTTKCRCPHGVPWYRECPWCGLLTQDLSWLLRWYYDPLFHANVTYVSRELALQVRQRMTG